MAAYLPHQSHPALFMTEYFIDKKKYSCLTILHMNAAFWIRGLAMIATGTMLITYLQYVCGMFSITR
jgi:hypothetical protein